MKRAAVPDLMIAIVEGERASDSNAASFAFRSISGRAPTSSPSRCKRSNRKKTSAVALPLSDAAWIMLNEVMPSWCTPHSSPSR
jgi:hypothetical protein